MYDLTMLQESHVSFQWHISFLLKLGFLRGYFNPRYFLSQSTISAAPFAPEEHVEFSGTLYVLLAVNNQQSEVLQPCNADPNL